MAELSAETQAIIKTLKDEGTLVRNRGTNSIRSVKLQMDRFEGLFNSINKNIIAQTEILTATSIINTDAQEKASAQEQFDELERDAKKETKDKDNSKSKEKTDETIEKMGDKLAKVFSFKNILSNMKNLLVGGIAAFAGYNLLKGFINEKTGGGFDRFEEGIGTVGANLLDFKMPNIKETFDNLNKTMLDLQTTIAGMQTYVKETAEKLSDWGWWIGVAISAIGPFVAINTYLKLKLIQAKIELEKARIEDGKPPKATPSRGDGNAEANRRRADNNGQPRGNQARPSTGPAPEAPITRSGFDELDPRGRNQIRPSVAAASGGRVGYNATAGRFTGQGGGFLSDADALKIMESSVKDAKAYRNVMRVLKYVVAPAALIYELYRAYVVINSDMSRTQKIAELVGMFGGFIIGAKAATIAAVAALPAGPWAALAAGLVAGIAFGIAGEELVAAIMSWALGRDPTAADQERLVSIQRSTAGIIERYGEPSAYVAAMERAQMGGARAFSDSGYNPDIGNMSLGTDPITGANVTLGSKHRGNYYTDKNGILMFQPPGGGMPIRASERPGFRSQLDQVSNGGGSGSTVVISAPTTVAPNVNYTHGGNTESNLNVLNVGGSGGGGNGSLSPFVQ